MTDIKTNLLERTMNRPAGKSSSVNSLPQAKNPENPPGKSNWQIRAMGSDNSLVVKNDVTEKILQLEEIFPPTIKVCNIPPAATSAQVKKFFATFGSFTGFSYDLTKNEALATYQSWKEAEKLFESSPLKFGDKTVTVNLGAKTLQRTLMRLDGIPALAIQHNVFLVMKEFGWIRDPPIKLFRPAGAQCKYATLQYYTINQLVAALRASLGTEGIKIMGTRVSLTLPMCDFGNIISNLKADVDDATIECLPVKKLELTMARPIAQLTAATVAEKDHPAYKFPIRIQVRNVRGLTSESILRIYFENVKMSGGGPIESLKWQPEFNVAIIKFERHPEEEEMFSRLRNRKDFRLEGENLYVSFLPPICQRRCFLRDIPTSIVDEHLDDYMVARAKVDLESLQLSQAGTSRCALFTFKHDVALPKLQDLINKRKLMGFQPKLEPVRVADSVLISRLPDKCHEDTVMLTVTHLLSKIAGDYDIRYVVLSQKSRTAQVVFENYKTVDRLHSEFDINETTVTCQPFFDFIHGCEGG